MSTTGQLGTLESFENSGVYVVGLVDDDPSVRRSVSRLLESDGFNVLAFGEPSRFLQYLSDHFVEVVVLDLWMDHMTGIELLTQLSAKSPYTRVIFITGHDDAAARANIMQSGAFDFFLKPFDDGQFLAAVRRAFLDLRKKKTA